MWAEQHRRFASCLGVACLAFALAACQPATLIELNRNFVDLSQQQAEAEQLHRDGVLGATDFDAAVEGYRVAFAENGRRAEEAAKSAEDLQNKVSFLNVATRSYLKSGPLGSDKLDPLITQGIDNCRAEDLKGLNALPVTCGYFFLAEPQAVNDEVVRGLVPLRRKAPAMRQAGGSFSAVEGQQLEEAVEIFLDLIDALRGVQPQIDWQNADPALQSAFARHELGFFCNALDAWLYLGDTVPSGEDWDRSKVTDRTGRRLNQAQQALGVETPSVACGITAAPSG